MLDKAYFNSRGILNHKGQVIFRNSEIYCYVNGCKKIYQAKMTGSASYGLREVSLEEGNKDIALYDQRGTRLITLVCEVSEPSVQ